jgi:hypothetical protein
VQLRREMQREEREQHDRSRVLMGEEEEGSAQMSEGRLCTAAWRRNGGEGRGGRARGWSWRVEWTVVESES